MKKNKKINKEKNIAELIEEHPETAEVLINYGLHCVGCGASMYDSIEQGAKLHGLDDKTISEMVVRVNEVIEYKE